MREELLGPEFDLAVGDDHIAGWLVVRTLPFTSWPMIETTGGRTSLMPWPMAEKSTAVDLVVEPSGFVRVVVAQPVNDTRRARQMIRFMGWHATNPRNIVKRRLPPKDQQERGRQHPFHCRDHTAKD